jgi:alanine dehydrogenase
MALLLRETDVERLLDMPTALACVERAFVELGHGRATNLPRTRIHQKHGGLNLMAAGLPTFGVIGFKAYTWFTSGSKFMVNLYHSETGELLAIIEADRMGQMRTGAASGIATKWMAKEESTSIGIFGTGYQAQTQLQAVCAVRKIRRVRAFSRKIERRQSFCKTMEAALKIEVQPVAEARAVIEGSDIIITSTTATEPLFDGNWVSEGTHLNVIGGNSPLRAEVDTTTVLRSSRIIVDSLDQARVEAGEFLKCVERGLMYWEKVEELSSVVTGKSKGREGKGEITFFKSLGIALEDLAVGATVYEKAREQKVGERILV